MNKILLAASAAAILGFAGHARAADLSGKYEAPAELVSPCCNWSGFYIGGTLGGMYATATTRDTDYYDYGGDFSMPAVAFVYGAHAGYNWQRGMAVFGVEADINGSTFDQRVSRTYNDGDTVGFGATWNWFSTVRGRLGLTSGNAMAYVTGGVAFVDLKQSYRYVEGSDPYTAFNGVSTGFAVGAGIEVALNRNWFLRGEYLFIGLPGETKLLTDSGTTYRFDMSSEAHIARVGISYKFNNCCDYAPLK
jgi:outer membrane immunogenic protein